jgi:cytoskeletal protein RodZ
VICPNCREDNAPTFRFCGMCGTSLEPRRPGAPALGPLSAIPASPGPVSAPVSTAPISTAPVSTKTANSDPLRPLVVDNASNALNKQVPPISGPSMLGLDQVAAQSGPNQYSQDQPSINQPSIDSLREKSFSGLDSFFEHEPPKNSGGRILLMVVLLAALGGAGWWVYTNYLGPSEPRKAETATSSTTSSSGESPAETPSTKPESKDAAAAPDAGSSQAAVPTAAAPEGSSENANASPDAESKPVTEAKPATPAPSTPSTKIAPIEKIAAKREPGVTSARAAKAETSKQPAPEAADTGDADFRKADAFLYGRGAAENCDQAVKYLKSASAKSNAKARSAFGTMYATGHCVPRDLPTSYLWFALALQVDPNNQILEKDLNSVWSEMTPPERQLATRMKQ